MASPPRRLFLPTFLALLLSVACSDPDHAADHEMDSTEHAEHAEHGDHGHDHGDHGHHHHGMEATAGPGYTVADVEFMQMMMGHHAQAVVMSELAGRQGAGPQVQTLSQRIDLSQRDEMDFMAGWLEARGQQVPTPEQMSAMVMPGLVSQENMARLAAAEGTEFDRLFLEFMIEHHIGAVAMVEDLFAHPDAAQDSEIFPFAVDVAADQMDEIHIMERILQNLPSSSPE